MLYEKQSLKNLIDPLNDIYENYLNLEILLKRAYSEIRPFYELFFGEEFPKKIDVEEIGENPDKDGGYYWKEDKLEVIVGCSPHRREQILIHELGHRNYERESHLLEKTEPLMDKVDNMDLSWARFLPSLARNIFKSRLAKQINDIVFLHECIAYSVSFAFETYLGNGELLSSYNKGYVAREIWMYESSIADSEKPIKSIHMHAGEIGRVIGSSYQNDPNLWNKLKQIRTIKDLKGLVS